MDTPAIAPIAVSATAVLEAMGQMGNTAASTDTAAGAETQQKTKRPARERKKRERFALLHSMTIGAYGCCCIHAFTCAYVATPAQCTYR